MNLFSKIVSYEDTELKRMRRLKGSARQTKKLLSLEYGSRFPQRVSKLCASYGCAPQCAKAPSKISFHYDDDEVVLSCTVHPIPAASHIIIPIHVQGAAK